MTHSPLFLDDEELATLTGRKIKRLQCEQLRRMAIPFHVNALGKPVVARAALIGTATAGEQPRRGWTPRAVAAA